MSEGNYHNIIKIDKYGSENLNEIVGRVLTEVN